MPQRRPQTASYAWALRLSEPRYGGYIEERRRWLRLRGGADVWPRVLRGLEYGRALAELADARRQEAIRLAAPRAPRSFGGLEDGVSLDLVIARAERHRALDELAEQRRWERLGMSEDEFVPTPAKKFGRHLRRMEDDADFARLVLFGNVNGRAGRSIGDRAIRHRLQVFAEQATREPRYCSMANCANELPRNARSTRKRCDSCRAKGRRR
jgi:hypothetical protein